MFNTKGTDTTERGGVSKFISPGVHVCKIKNVEFFESNGGTPGLKFTFETKPVEGLLDDNGNKIGQTAETTYWLSPKAWSFSRANNTEGGTKVTLAIMADKLGIREQLDAIQATTPSEYATAAAAIFKGKTARFAFGGQEIVPSDPEKKTWVKSELLAFKFIESLTEVPNDADTKLVYDPSNAYHLKKAEVTSATVLDASSSTDDVPWG